MADLHRILTDAIALLEARHYERVKLAMYPNGETAPPRLAVANNTIAISMRGAIMAVAKNSHEASYAIQALNIKGMDPNTRAGAIKSLKAALASLHQPTLLGAS